MAAQLTPIVTHGAHGRFHPLVASWLVGLLCLPGCGKLEQREAAPAAPTNARRSKAAGPVTLLTQEVEVEVVEPPRGGEAARPATEAATEAAAGVATKDAEQGYDRPDDKPVDVPGAKKKPNKRANERANERATKLDESTIPTAPQQRFLPRTAYFENTYLGGNAAYAERLRRLSHDLPGSDAAWLKAHAAVAEMDPPSHAGMGLSATLSRQSLRRPGRVWLQIGLRGSGRYGWRRPPLDVSLIIRGDALTGDAARELTRAAIRQVVRRLGPQDRVEVRIEAAAALQPAMAASDLRHQLAALFAKLDAQSILQGTELDVQHRRTGAPSLRRTLVAAGDALVRLSANPHRVPGTRLVLLLTGAGSPTIAAQAKRAAHTLQLRGVVTSVLSVATTEASKNAADPGWWRVANAGHGNFHQLAERSAAAAVQDELDTLGRVVARLLRINIRLRGTTQAVRILGAKVLGQAQVARVKARELRMDQALSASLGVATDRGDDDDGLQTVIPYFYGDDSHVLLVELWVQGPGAVADITLRYKDLVHLDNATERVSVALSSSPRGETPAQREVRQNVRSMELGLALEGAWLAVQRAGVGVDLAEIPGLQRALQRALTLAEREADRSLVRGLMALVRESDSSSATQRRAVRDALRMARDRKVGG